MRRALKILVGLVITLAVAGAAILTVPQISEKSLELTCSRSAPNENCVARMRALGHVWSQKDDFDRASGWYARAAASGDRIAMFHLAWIYEQAGKRDRDADDEKRRQKIAAGVGYSDLGPAPDGGANMVRAADWYRKAADKGFAPAMNNLGELYMVGLGVPRNEKEGFRWMLAAARAGNPVAPWNVVFAYLTTNRDEFEQSEFDKWLTWTPKGMIDDLAEPTLQRTNMNGEAIPVQYRQLLRAAAEQGVPVNLTMSPLQASSSSTFQEQVTR